MDRYADLDLDCDEGGVANPGLSVSSDDLTESQSSKAGVLSGRLQRPSPGRERRSSQDLLDAEFRASTDGHTAKEKGGVFSGMFKKKPHGARSQEDVSAAELSGSKDSLSVNESGGVFGGMFRKSPKAYGARTQSQEDVSAAGEPSGSADSRSLNSNPKESGGGFGGMFRKSPKAYGARTQSQEDLSAELSSSKDSLSVTSNTKESGGVFGGMFRKTPKALGARTQSQDGLSEAGEPSGSDGDPSEGAKEKGGLFGGVFKKKGARHQSQDDLSADSKLSTDRLADKSSKEKISDSDELPDDGESRPGHKQSTFAEAMGKMNPFRSNKHEKQTSSDDEDPPGNKTVLVQKDAEDTETIRDNEKPHPRQRKDRSETPVVPSRPTEEDMKRTSTHGGAVDNPRRPSGSNEGKPAGRTAVGAIKPRRLNPFTPRSEAPSGDEGLEGGEEEEEEDPSSKEEKKDEDKTQSREVKKPRRLNPFMPRNNKAKNTQRNKQEGAAGHQTESERSLFDRLEDFRIDPLRPEDRQDVENLMAWWDNVESWEDTPQEEDMTEKEEANC
ncbi:dentin matrix acidic phosphoprotein 1-like isoform X3 [Pseudoliparis swirei]|uniref:dentin matrix acidic phosphoprotein 1-like isoform X3 n=1 Tax=Pseudoliparis swirei TaxID=2059687 RepID=UPI0024BE0838|nr:dentin matrix acidic phosphoprotein 1-like isoform X3 [Pseudoliparis swirei]